MPRIVLQEVDSDRPLTAGELEAVIGRDPACGFVIDGPKSKVVSGRHARIFFQDGSWWIQDMSRNGTVLDDERLQGGQRHALKAGQTIGLGDTGPRLRVVALEERNVAETMIEADVPSDIRQTTAPRARPRVDLSMAANPPAAPAVHPASPAGTTHLDVDEATEPAKLSGDWHIALTLRATHSDQRFETRAAVVKVGRSPECTVRIPPEQGASVSRVHLEIAIGESGVVVRDAGSRNGTFVNGNRIQGAHPLVTGDRITLGAGGPTLEVTDLHILRGEGPRQSPAGGRGIGGGLTPDAQSASQGMSQPFREPPTAPSPQADPGAIAATRVQGTHVASPARGVASNAQQSTVGREPSRNTRILLFALIGLLLFAVAVMLGRLTAS